MNVVVGREGSGGTSVPSAGGVGTCEVRTCGAEATVGGMTGVGGGAMGDGDCRNGSGVRNAEFIVRPVLLRRSWGACGKGVRNDGILRVCGSC